MNVVEKVYINSSIFGNAPKEVIFDRIKESLFRIANQYPNSRIITNITIATIVQSLPEFTDNFNNDKIKNAYSVGKIFGLYLYINPDLAGNNLEIAVLN